MSPIREDDPRREEAEEKDGPSQEELDARDVAKAQNASPRQHQQGVDAIERLQDGDLEESEQEALQDGEDDE